MIKISHYDFYIILLITDIHRTFCNTAQQSKKCSTRLFSFLRIFFLACRFRFFCECPDLCMYKHTHAPFKQKLKIFDFSFNFFCSSFGSFGNSFMILFPKRFDCKLKWQKKLQISYLKIGVLCWTIDWTTLDSVWCRPAMLLLYHPFQQSKGYWNCYSYWKCVLVAE